MTHAERAPVELSVRHDGVKWWVSVPADNHLVANGGPDMVEFVDSYVCRVLLPTRSMRGLGTVADQWRPLRTNISNPYRPELHYARGPGPKWREKHENNARYAALVVH